MEMEARSFSTEKLRALLVKVKDYKADLAALRTDLKKVCPPPRSLCLPRPKHVPYLLCFPP